MTDQIYAKNEHQDQTPLLEIKSLKKYFPIQKGFFKTVVGHVKAVDDISMYVNEGETLGLVGESGCGKTTTGRCILKAITPSSGEIWFNDPDMGRVNVNELEHEQLVQVRRNMRMIFQDPYASLNPRMTLQEIVGAPLRAMKLAKGKELEDRVAEMLRRVGLRPEYMRRYPHAFSGGQRQRIGLARALAPNPKFLVCDEPVSALDVSVQAQILNLLKDLQRELHLTYLFIAHDLSVVEHICSRVGVMYLGRLFEMAKTDELFYHPLHPYTEALMSAIPEADPKLSMQPIKLTGEIPSPIDPPPGCSFHPRCHYAQEICSQARPDWVEKKPGHFVACHFADKLQLKGFTG